MCIEHLITIILSLQKSFPLITDQNGNAGYEYFARHVCWGIIETAYNWLRKSSPDVSQYRN